MLPEESQQNQIGLITDSPGDIENCQKEEITQSIDLNTPLAESIDPIIPFVSSENPSLAVTPITIEDNGTKESIPVKVEPTVATEISGAKNIIPKQTKFPGKKPPIDDIVGKF